MIKICNLEKKSDKCILLIQSDNNQRTQEWILLYLYTNINQMNMEQCFWVKFGIGHYLA